MESLALGLCGDEGLTPGRDLHILVLAAVFGLEGVVLTRLQ